MNLIPNNPNFSKILNSLTLQPPDEKQSGQYDYTIALSRESSIDQFGYRKTDAELRLWYRNDCGIQYDSLHEKVKKCLESLDHPANNDIVAIILAFYTLAVRNEEDAVQAFNSILLSICRCDVSQYVITEIDIPLEFKINFDSFFIHRFNPEKFNYRCKKTQSDYYDLYGNGHLGKLTVEKDFFSINVIDWYEVFSKLEIFNEKSLSRRIGSAYFHIISQSLWEFFWDSFVSSQHIYNAISDTYLDPFEILSLSGSNSFVTIFLNIGKRKNGFVSPFGGITIGIGKFEKSIPIVHKELEEVYQFISFNDTNIVHKYLKMYTSYISKAKIHLYHGRYDESFLLFIIALELLLGEKGKSTQSITERVSILTHKQFNIDYHSQKKYIEDLYEVRSKYVHEGKAIKKDTLKDISKITSIILKVLFELQKPSRNPSNFKREQWFKEMKFMVASVESGRQLTDEQYNNVGVY